MTLPTERLAAKIATQVTGQTPMEVHRFATGTSHYVFEALFPNWSPIVVRIGSHAARPEMEGAIHLSGLLRSRGVPLPEILAHGINDELPWLALERLPGTDLGAVISGLNGAQLERIAANVASAQAITALTAPASVGRFGYATRPDQAPCSTWSEVIEASLNRSRQRIISARLFDPAMVDAVHSAMAAHRVEIDRIEPIPFLHDTTTKNVIVTQNGVFSGIVDVDDLCFGDPRYPAALTLAVLLAYGGPVEYVSAWLRNAGKPDDATFRFYVSLFLLDLMAEHGQAFNGNERVSAPKERGSLLRAFQNSLQEHSTGYKNS